MTAVRRAALVDLRLGKAIAYMTGMWSGLVRFLDDPRIPIDNNQLERSLRGPVFGRKNHYGSRSQRGTEVAALLYSLVETAKLCGVEPKRYLITALRCARRGEPIPLPHELRPDDPPTGSPTEALAVPARPAARRGGRAIAGSAPCAGAR